MKEIIIPIVLSVIVALETLMVRWIIFSLLKGVFSKEPKFSVWFLFVLTAILTFPGFAGCASGFAGFGFPMPLLAGIPILLITDGGKCGWMTLLPLIGKDDIWIAGILSHIIWLYILSKTAISIVNQKMPYWNPLQKIDFAAIMPNKLEYCGNSLDQSAPEYIELLNWFKSNQFGWRKTSITYTPVKTYKGSNISVNILGNGVVVNYQNKDGNWIKVEKQKMTNELSNKC